MAQAVECLPSKCKVLSSNGSTAKKQKNPPKKQKQDCNQGLDGQGE
jgi:hypothetical protein